MRFDPLRKTLISTVLAVAAVCAVAVGLDRSPPEPTGPLERTHVAVEAPSETTAPEPRATVCGGPPVDGFDLPVGAPDGEGYRDAQPFGRNRHLGNDWNGVGGGNTDLGDPVYAIADGVVTSARDVRGGWGLVVRIAHPIENGCVESLYAHLLNATVSRGEPVRRGQPIGAIGDAWGAYLAHLHFELRDRVGAPLGAGYGSSSHHLDPTAFIRARRPSASHNTGAPPASSTPERPGEPHARRTPAQPAPDRRVRTERQ